VTTKLQAGILAAAVLLLGGCGSGPPGGTVAMPVPSPGDTEGQIMSVTGPGFTTCDVNDDGPDHYDVTICGSVATAQTVLDARFPGKCTVSAYQPDDGGPHTPQQQVMQWWINRITGPGFVITSTQIMANGKIDVGVDGDLKAAETALDRTFPGWTDVHSQAEGTLLMVTPSRTPSTK
jgi:hypothetical protein